MATDDKNLTETLATLRRRETRSALFYWLVEHHDELLKAVGDGRVDWQIAAERFKELGLTDATGKPASAQRARATWYKVRQFVAKRHAASAATRAGKVRSSRISVAAQPLTTSAPRPSTPAPRASGAPQDAPSEATRAELDRLREKLRTRDY